MNRLPKLGLAAMLVLLLSAASARADYATGTVTELFPDQMQFVIIDHEGKMLTFKMDEDAQVYIDDRPAVLEDVMTGDRVEIIYRVEEADLLAIEVRITR